MTKRHALRALLALTLAASALTSRASACDCGNPGKAIAAPSPASQPGQKEAPKKHPLKGVVTDLLPDDSALMVKHEAIPGVMRAMTMMLTVDPAVLSTVKKGDPITGLLYRDPEGTWRLDDVKVIPSAPST